MKEHIETTKELLLITAGKLFAQYGYDGVSTRMITDKAELKLSSIHYHFGSKEKLYIDACTYAKDKGARVTFLDVAEENPSLLSTPVGQAEIIRNTVFRRFHDYFRPDRARWEIQILVRELVTPSSALPALTLQLFKPEDEAIESFYKMIRPDGGLYECRAWCDLFHSQMMFYSIAREPLKLVRGENAISDEFLREVSRNLSRALILVLGLPLPQDLQ